MVQLNTKKKLHRLTIMLTCKRKFHCKKYDMVNNVYIFLFLYINIQSIKQRNFGARWKNRLCPIHKNVSFHDRGLKSVLLPHNPFVISIPKLYDLLLKRFWLIGQDVWVLLTYIYVHGFPTSDQRTSRDWDWGQFRDPVSVPVISGPGHFLSRWFVPLSVPFLLVLVLVPLLVPWLCYLNTHIKSAQ